MAGAGEKERTDMSIIEKVKEGLGGRVVQWHEHSPRRIYITIKPADLQDAVKLLFNDLKCRFAIATGTDAIEGLEITYHFSYDSTGQFFSLRIYLADRQKPEVGTISHIVKGAEWIEREIWELLGVNFTGHPDLRRLLLSDSWPEGEYPLRRQAEKRGED